ncbi:hypothetical protein NC651_030218 [Populus alba x Populus x berolinensis]|nr:hypothetical protein NC651_030218 [Populus alba x Populus x berolinensis]
MDSSNQMHFRVPVSISNRGEPFKTWNDSPLLRNMCHMSNLLGKNGFSNFLDKAVKSFLSSLNRLKQIPILAFKPFRKCCLGKGFCVLYDLSSMFVNLTFKIKRPLAQLYVG